MTRLLLLVLGLGGDCPSKSWAATALAASLSGITRPAPKEANRRRDGSPGKLPPGRGEPSCRTVVGEQDRPGSNTIKRRTYGAHSSNTGRWGDLA